MVKLKHINRNSKFAKFETIDGCEGMCLGVNDTRVKGPKPWGGGRVISVCYPNKERLLKLMDGKESVDIYIVDYGFKGYWIDGVNLCRKGTKKDYENHLKKMEFLKKKHTTKAFNEYYQCFFKDVKVDDIKKVMDSPFYVEC